MKLTPITVERCQCGHRSCKTHWLKGIGTFTQGSGFTLAEANALVVAFNSMLQIRQKGRSSPAIYDTFIRVVRELEEERS